MGDRKYTELSLPLCSESSSESSSKSSYSKRTAAKLTAGISGLVIFGYFMSATFSSTPEAGALNLVSSEARLPALADQYQLELVSAPKMVAELGNPDTSYGKITLSKDNSLAALANYRSEIQVWDVKKNELVVEFSNGDLAGYLLFTPDSKYLISRYKFGSIIKIWSLETKSLHGQIRPGGHILSPFVTSDSKLLAFKSSNEVSFWDIATLKMSHTLKVRDDSSLNDIAITPDTRYLAMAISGGVNIIEVYDLSTMKKISTINTEIEPTIIKICDDGKIVATAERWGKSAYIFNVQAGTLISNVNLYNAGIMALGLSPDGGILFMIGTYYYKVIIYDLKLYKTIGYTRSYNPRCEFTKDSKLLIALDYDYVRVIDLENGNEVATLGVGMKPIEDFYLSDNGEYLLVSTDERVCLWSLNTRL